MISQQILLGLPVEGAPVVPPPVLVPSGDPFIIDLDFPGDPALITMDAVYTFPQAVSFKNSTFILGAQPFIDSTFTYTGAPVTQVNFYIKPYLPSEQDYVGIVFQNPPNPNAADGVFRAQATLDGSWIPAHSSGGDGPPYYGSNNISDGVITFFAGDQLFLQLWQNIDGFGTLADIHLHLVGVAV